MTNVTETEKFVEANTQELAKDKWLCPLSGKKFRGPEFVKKHIYNKHMDKVDAVRMEVSWIAIRVSWLKAQSAYCSGTSYKQPPSGLANIAAA